MWWNLTLCTCPEFNKLFPCFMAFVDGCIYVSTSSSITSGKLRLLSSHPSWRLPGKGRVIPHSMVNFSLRLVETSSSSSRVVLATSKFNFHAKYAFSASSYFLPDKTTPLFFKNVFNWSTFHLENSSIDIPSVKLRCLTFADCRLQTTDCRPLTADYRLQTAYSGPQTVDYKRRWLTAGRKSWRLQSLNRHNPCRFEIMTLWPRERQYGYMLTV